MTAEKYEGASLDMLLLLMLLLLTILYSHSFPSGGQFFHAIGSYSLADC